MNSIEIIQEYGKTKRRIALSYYYDHQTEIDAAIQAENEEFEQQVATNSNKISQLQAQSKQ